MSSVTLPSAFVPPPSSLPPLHPASSARLSPAAAAAAARRVLDIVVSVLLRSSSTFERPGGHAGDEEPLEQQEEHQYRNEGEERPDDEQLIVVRIRSQQRVEPDRKRELLSGTQHQERPEEVVPDDHPVENGHGRDRWFGDRQHKLEKDAELGHAVDPARLQQLLRNSQEILPEEEDGDRRRQERQDDHDVRSEEHTSELQS